MSNIYEVAKRAGVSTATVSRVLSQPLVVSPATRARVLHTVERLGYTPNATAKHLRMLRTGKILVTVPDLSNPFFSLILQAIEDAAQRAGYSVLVGDTQRDDQREAQYAAMLKRKEADGLIFFGHQLPRDAADLVRQSAPRAAPVVQAAGKYSRRLRVSSVHIDNARAGDEAMRHLYGLGHRRIGIITGPLAIPLNRDRLRGAIARAHASGAAGQLIVLNGDFSIESGMRCTERLLRSRRRPTALFCFNDEMAIGAIEAARHAGLAVPADLSVVGFDDIRFARYTHPPLTTIAQPMRQFGEEAVRVLLGILNGNGEAAGPSSVKLPHELIVRGSTAPP